MANQATTPVSSVWKIQLTYGKTYRNILSATPALKMSPGGKLKKFKLKSPKDTKGGTLKILTVNFITLTKGKAIL